MLNVHIFSKKKKKQTNCDLLPLGSLFLLGLNSAPLSLSFPSQTNSGRKEKRGGGGGGGGGGNIGRLPVSWWPTLTCLGSLTLGQMGLYCFVLL